MDDSEGGNYGTMAQPFTSRSVLADIRTVVLLLIVNLIESRRTQKTGEHTSGCL
jgi:hypothetical protein